MVLPARQVVRLRALTWVRSPAEIRHLAEACHQDIHEFWPDEVSLLDSHVVDSTRIHGPRPLTDIYLLALAVQHQGRLVTSDTGIPLAAPGCQRAGYGAGLDDHATHRGDHGLDAFCTPFRSTGGDAYSEFSRRVQG
jgi:hypothetical protein